MNKAVDYLVKNVILKNKSMREDALRSYPNLSARCLQTISRKFSRSNIKSW